VLNWQFKKTFQEKLHCCSITPTALQTAVRVLTIYKIFTYCCTDSSEGKTFKEKLDFYSLSPTALQIFTYCITDNSEGTDNSKIFTDSSEGV